MSCSLPAKTFDNVSFIRLLAVSSRNYHRWLPKYWLLSGCLPFCCAKKKPFHNLFSRRSLPVTCRLSNRSFFWDRRFAILIEKTELFCKEEECSVRQFWSCEMCNTFQFFVFCFIFVALVFFQCVWQKYEKRQSKKRRHHWVLIWSSLSKMAFREGSTKTLGKISRLGVPLTSLPAMRSMIK